MTVCTGYFDAFTRILFHAYGAAGRCTDHHAVVAFATLAALAFAAFVVIDVMVLLVRRYGFIDNRASEPRLDGTGTVGSIIGKALAVAAFGTVAAWIVAFFAAIVEFAQTTPQTAVATGVLWQVTYVQLLSRFGGKQPEPPGDEDTETENTDQTPLAFRAAASEAAVPVQRFSEEVAQ